MTRGEKQTRWFSRWRSILANDPESAARDMLALERTFLSWFRSATYLALIAAGVIQTDLVRRAKVTAIILISVSGVMVLFAFQRYFVVRELWKRDLIDEHKWYLIISLYTLLLGTVAA